MPSGWRPPLPELDDERAKQFTQLLGMQPEHEWVTVRANTPITNGHAEIESFGKLGGHSFPNSIPIQDGESFEGFHFEFFGPRLNGPHELLPFIPPGARLSARFYALTVQGRPSPVMIWKWFERAWFEGSPLWAERQWHPAIGQLSSAVRGWDTPHSTRDISGAQKALDLLEALTTKPGGAPKGWRKGEVWPRQRYLDWYAEASQFNEPRLIDLATAMGVSEDTARGRLRAPDVNLPWPPQAYQETWGLDD
jgi:hypothetical protein